MEAGVPPLEALPAPVEEVSLEERRPELDFVHHISTARARMGFCEVGLVPLVVLPG